MDLLIPLAVLLLAVAVVLLIMAKRGKARQTARTAEQYGAGSTYQPTFDVPQSQIPDSSPALPDMGQPEPLQRRGAPDGGSGDEVRDLAERLANDIRESLLKGVPKGSITVETTVTSTSTAPPWSHITGVQDVSRSTGGTGYTERSLSLTEADATRIKALAAAGQRAKALALLTAETGMGTMAAQTMLDMIMEAEL